MPHRTLLGLASVLALVAAPALAQSSSPPSVVMPSPMASDDQAKPPADRAVVPATDSNSAQKKSDSDKAAQQKADADKKADSDKKADKDNAKNLPPPKQVGALTGNEAHGLIGRDIHNAAGDKIGTLKNVIVGPDGRVAAGIVDFGGWLSSSKQVAVDWKSLQPAGDKITLNLAKDQLEAAGPFREGESSAIVSAEPMQSSNAVAGSGSMPTPTMSGSSGADQNSSIGGR